MKILMVNKFLHPNGGSETYIFKLGQELDPITGKPTKSSQWYSSCMLMYLYAAQRLKKGDKENGI